MSIDKLFSKLKGGAGSGNFGHGGRPGKRGGSSPKGSITVTLDLSLSDNGQFLELKSKYDGSVVGIDYGEKKRLSESIRKVDQSHENALATPDLEIRVLDKDIPTKARMQIYSKTERRGVEVDFGDEARNLLDVLNR